MAFLLWDQRRSFMSPFAALFSGFPLHEHYVNAGYLLAIILK